MFWKGSNVIGADMPICMTSGNVTRMTSQLANPKEEPYRR